MTESIINFSKLKPLVLVAASFLMTVFSACGILNSEESFSMEIETDKDIYVISEDDFAIVTIKNTSDKTVFYSTCLKDD